MTRLWPLLGATMAIGLLVSGCGGQEPAATAPSSAPSSASSAEPSSSATPTARSGEPSGTPTAPSTSTAPTRAASVTPTPLPGDSTDLSSRSLALVVSPARDIACMFEASGGATVRCDVQGAQWQVATPKSCPGVYGDSVQLRHGRASLVCHGDTIFDPKIKHVLGHGHRVTYRGVTCRSKGDAISCVDGAGHGFTVSPKQYRLS